VRDALGVEVGAEEREKRRELREDEEAVAVVEGLGEEFAEGFEFRGVIGGDVGLDEAGVAADLAKAEELGEGGELEFALAGAGGFEVDEIAFGFFLGVAVKLGLGGREFAPNCLLQFLGELGGDGAFGAAENVRRGLGAEAFVEPGAFVAAEARRDAGEVAGEEEFEEGAEIVEGVFERRAREQEAGAGAEGAEGGGVLRAAVLDVLGFVGDDAGELDGGEETLVAGERAVARDDEIAGGEVGGGLEAVGRVVDERAELRSEAGGFAAPVFEEGGGADDERSSRGGGAES
jgi:hypothetical protein